MSLILIDGCKHYSTGSGDWKYKNKWDYQGQSAIYIQNIADATLRTGAYVLRNWDYNHGFIETVINPGLEYIYVGLAIKVTTDSIRNIINFDGHTNFVLSTAAGTITANYQGGSKSSPLGIIDINTWYHYQFALRCHDTLGEILVKINNTEVINETGIDTLNGTDAFFRTFGFHGDNANFSDIYIDNAQLHGPCRVDTLFPNGVGNYSQMTPSAGSNYECVNEYPFNTTDFVTGDAANEKDSYAMENISAKSGSAIKAVALNICGNVDDPAQNAKYKGFLRIGSSDYEHSSEYTVRQAAHRHEQMIWENNPADSQPFEEVDINGLEAGLRISAL